MYGKRVNAKVILNTGDSVVGVLKPKGEYSGRIKLKTRTGKVKIDINDIEILKLNVLQYKPVKINGRQLLLEEVAYGKYSLFAYLKKSDNRSTKYFFLKVPNKSAFLVVPENFQIVCEDYLFDDDYIRQKIETGEWAYADLLKIFRVYNYRFQKNEKGE